MTEGQIKAMFTLLEYTAKQVVEVRKQLAQFRNEKVQNLRRLRESNAQMRTEILTLRKENQELHTFLNQRL